MKTSPASRPSEAEIRAYAYQIYLHDGCIRGRELADWFEAEAQLRAIAQLDSARSTSRPRRRASRPRVKPKLPPHEHAFVHATAAA